MKKTIRLLWLGLSCLVLQGCAHTALEKQLDEKLTRESGITDRKMLKAEAVHTIATAPGLSMEQRTELTSLRRAVTAELDKISEQSLKLRALLVRDVISSSYNGKEVDLIKSRMKDLENRRLSVLFNSVEKANTILGRQAADNERIVRDLFDSNRG